METKKEKICPLQLGVNNATDYCYKDDCAWYTKGGLWHSTEEDMCAIVAIARNIVASVPYAGHGDNAGHSDM